MLRRNCEGCASEAARPRRAPGGAVWACGKCWRERPVLLISKRDDHDEAERQAAASELAKLIAEPIRLEVGYLVRVLAALRERIPEDLSLVGWESPSASDEGEASVEAMELCHMAFAIEESWEIEWRAGRVCGELAGAAIEAAHRKAVKQGDPEIVVPPPEAMHGACDGFPGSDYP